jgi:hypothetical protein
MISHARHARGLAWLASLLGGNVREQPKQCMESYTDISIYGSVPYTPVILSEQSDYGR